MKTLIISDNKTTANQFSTLLQKQNHNTTIATTGNKALQLINKGDFHLVFLELDMPDNESETILKKIRDRKPIIELPVILIIDHTLTTEAEKFFEFGANDFISKSPDEFLLKLRIKTLTELRLSCKTLHRDNETLQLKNAISNAFLSDTGKVFYQTVLDIALERCNSQYGYFGYIDPEDSALICPSMTFEVWDKCRIENKTIVFKEENWGGIWGESLKKKQSVLKNSRMVLPNGHIQLKNALAVPIIHNRQLIGQIVVADKPNDYTKNDKQKLEEICSYIAPLLASRLAGKKQKAELQYARKTVEEGEVIFRAVFENARDGILLANAQNKQFAMANHAICTMLGYTKEEIYGLSVNDIHPKNELPRIQTIFEKQLNNECILARNLPVKRKDNRIFYADISSSPVIIDEQKYLLAIFRDNTEQKKIREQIQMLSTVIEQTSSYVLITDLDGTIEYTNPAFTNITGYDFDEVKGKNPRILKSGKVKTEIYNQLWNTLKQGKSWKGEFINRRKNGEEFYEKAVISPIKNSDGTVIKYAAIKEDITEQKRNEKELLESANIIKATFDSTSENFFLVDREYNILAYNKTSAQNIQRIWNKTLKKGDNMSLYSNPANWEGVVKNTDKAFTGEKVQHELKIDYESGLTLWFHVKYLPVYDTDNKICAVSFTSNDITERKLAEQALRESEELFKQIAENINAVLYVYNPGSNKFLYVSPAFKKIWEMPLDKVMRNAGEFIKLVHPNDIKEFNEAVRKEMEEKVYFNKEYRIVMPDGRIKWIHSRNFPVYNQAGKPYRTVGIAENRTHLKEIEQKLRQANATKDKLLSIIGHDLKNPLSNIIGFTDLLEKHFDDSLNEKAKNFIHIINQSAHSLYSLIINLLTWSRSQRKLIQTHPEMYYLYPMVDNCLVTQHHAAHKKHIELVNAVPEKIKVYADKNLITTVVRNLISNAVKFTEQNGTITVGAEQNNKSVIVSVRDTGIGMDTETANNIFQFNKLNTRQGTDGEKGTGLGLIICKEFVEQNQGEIWVESSVGKGTTFYFSLPAHSQV